MDGPQQDLLAHVPAQFKAGCVPGPLLGVKAQIVCTGPPGIPIIVYTAYDSAATMDETFRSDTFGGISSCTGGRYERSYYQSTEKQSGRVICDVDANIPRIDWTDDRLAIIVTAKSTDLESGGELSLEGLHRWWEKREAGPIP